MPCKLYVWDRVASKLVGTQAVMLACCLDVDMQLSLSRLPRKNVPTSEQSSNGRRMWGWRPPRSPLTQQETWGPRREKANRGDEVPCEFDLTGEETIHYSARDNS